MRRAFAAFTLAAAFGCSGRSELPEVSSHTSEALTRDDVAILSAAWPAVWRYGNADPQTADVIMPDRTVVACDPPQFQGSYECIWPNDLRRIDSLMTELAGSGGPAAFRRRNSRASDIAAIDSGINLVPSAQLHELLGEPRWPQRLSRVFSGKQHVAMFSAPVYLSPDDGVVYVLNVLQVAAVVELTRQGDEWSIRAVRPLWIQ